MADVIYLVRHAAPPEAGRGRFWGRRDPGVDAAGLAGVASLAQLPWAKVDRLLSSPLARTMATAEPLAQALGLSVETAEDLAEADFGRFDGMTYAEIEARYPDEARRWMEAGDAFAFPEGETVPGFLARAERAWERVTALPETSVLAVTHGGIISAWTCLFLRMDFAHRFAFRPAYAALTAFFRKRDGSGWEMAFFNNKA